MALHQLGMYLATALFNYELSLVPIFIIVTHMCLCDCILCVCGGGGLPTVTRRCWISLER